MAAHRQGSFFHSRAWARVLSETYGHRPFYFSKISEGQLVASLPIMEVSSSWTGKRGVSPPFTDFCTPLESPGDDANQLYHAATEQGRKRGWRYLECRSNDPGWPNARPSVSFYAHTIELDQTPDTAFKKLDNALRRGIRKTEAAGIRVEFSTSPEAMSDYYALHCQTRRRHSVPPQPFRFFENIASFVLARDHGFIATARLQGRAVAAAVFFHFGRHAIYKFGASDFSFQQLRPNNLMMWEAIKRCAAGKFATLHLGRTSLFNEGLRRFKLSLGASEERLDYFKYDFKKGAFVTDVDRAETRVNQVFRRFPAPLLRCAGRMLYPHLS